jgi:plasmid replication initiation protein
MAIIKHNKLIETSYKLGAREQFFVLHLISEISQNHSDFQEHKMHYSEIEKIINFDGKRRIANKSEVFSLMDKLNSEPIIYEKGSVIGKSVWLQHMEHDTDTDIFTFSLSQRLREYLLQLKEHFTKYNLSNIVYLNANAVRLYEVLKRYQFKGECELTVDKVKFYLGIEDRYWCHPKEKLKNLQTSALTLFPSKRIKNAFSASSFTSTRTNLSIRLSASRY